MDELKISGSTPTLTAFNPNDVFYQMVVIDMIRTKFDYSQGVHEILLSGSIGSAKSLLMAHLAVTHCLIYSHAKFLIGRNSMPDLKSTILKKVLDHMRGTLIEGKDFVHNKQSGFIKFSNGAEIICLSWGDGDYQRFRSYEFSAGCIEELTENDSDETKEFHTEMIGRIGRIHSGNSNVKENFVIYATNPDDPSHYAHDYFIKNSLPDPKFDFVRHKENIHVVYSLTEQNTFLPKWYIGNLRKTFDSKMCQRLLEGKWIYINTDVVYYEYQSDLHYNFEFNLNEALPIRLSFDFNIAIGKPMSSLLLQHNPRSEYFYFYDEVVIEGSRTLDQMEEWASKGTFDLDWNPKIIIHGDATGDFNNTNSKHSNYDIIDKFLANYRRKDGNRLKFEIDVPLQNPPLKTRHNLVNGRLKNAEGNIFVKLHKNCVILDEGFSKTKLLENSKYIEDDSKRYQHVTTAAGYAICSCVSAEILDDIRNM